MLKIKRCIESFIEKEKNVRVRERFESRLRRKVDVILLILLGSTLFSGAKSLISAMLVIFIAILCLVVYYLVELWILERYESYTDYLIRKPKKQIILIPLLPLQA